MHRRIPRVILPAFLIAVTILPAFPASPSKGLATRTTANFRFRYERGVSAGDITRIGKQMEKLYEEYSGRLGLTLHRKVDVYAYESADAYRRDSKYSVFDEAAIREGKIYLHVSTLLKVDTTQSKPLARVVSEAILGDLKACPRWLDEVYGIYAGRDISRFGSPAQSTASSFSDLTEDYSRAESGKDLAELYAKLAATTRFLAERYGEQKLEKLYRQFSRPVILDDAFEGAFGEKMPVIEKAWSAALRSPPKG